MDIITLEKYILNPSYGSISIGYTISKDKMVISLQNSEFGGNVSPYIYATVIGIKKY